MAALESADTRRHLTLQEESAARLAPSRLVGQWISTAYGVGHVKSFAKTWNPLLYDSKHEVHFPEHGALELVLRRRKFAGWNSGIPFHLVQVVTPPVMSAQEGSGGSSSSVPSGSSGGGGEVLPPQSLERAAGEEATSTVQALPQLTGSATPGPLPAEASSIFPMHRLSTDDIPHEIIDEFHQATVKSNDATAAASERLVEKLVSIAKRKASAKEDVKYWGGLSCCSRASKGAKKHGF